MRLLPLLACLVLPASAVLPAARAAAPTGAWSPVTFTHPALRAAGTTTGDGCQWVRALAIAPTDGDFMLWCTDVGGLFRSLDRGKNWEPANVGFHSRGSSGVAIDPHNAKRVLVVAANSVAHRFNGLYLSTDQAASWTQVLPVVQSATEDQRVQLAFDPSTHDETAGLTRVAYWSTLSVDEPKWGDTLRQPALYKTTDGGSTWAKVPGGELVADAHLAVHPKNGYIYAATPRGLYLSTDAAATWRLALEGPCTGVSVTPAAPDLVYVTQPQALLHSTDAGATWAPLPGSALVAAPDSVLHGLVVAPSDPQRLVVWRRSPEWRWPRFVSRDGGATWTESSILRDRTLVPTNARQGLFAIHPTGPDLVLSTGGDYPTLSRDGGLTYALAGNGVNNLFVGATFNFSAVDPDVLFLGSQDYATFLTTDGGLNWSYTEPGQKGWGGYNYAAYASTPDALVVGEAEAWGSPKLRAVSRDRGATWQISSTPIDALVSYGDPRAPATLFAGRHRSTDAGATWHEMSGVSGVHTHDAADGALYGLHAAKDASAPGTAIVRSTDGGATWSELFRVSHPVTDLAVDPVRRRVYLAADEGGLRAWQDGTFIALPALPRDQIGGARVNSVAVDPVDPAVLYVAGCRNVFASDASALRSTDAGANWQNLNLTTPLDGTVRDGGRESFWVRVNPKTREAWFATSCYGVWKYSAPSTAYMQLKAE